LRIFEFLGLLRIVEGMKSIFRVVDEQIADHESTFDGDNMRDFIDCFVDKRILNERF
jgi:hypothetical protein